jgi:Protein of unknown function (DUF3631)
MTPLNNLESTSETTHNPKHVAPPKRTSCAAAKLLDDIASYFRRYLVCSDDQLTVMALWSLYTWCFKSFSIAPYLAIRSPESQSGKTICLHLLESVCNHPELISGASARTLESRLTCDRTLRENEFFRVSPPFTFFIDDCQNILGPSERQPLVALLNAGWDRASRYVERRREICVFGPKAFAGNAPLPPSLASRCIPIVLRRPRPADNYEWFRPWLIAEEADALAGRIQDWVKENSSGLLEAECGDIDPFPQTLTPRQQDCAEPLLRVARLVGGHWPEKAFNAFTAIFQSSERSPSISLLSDMRLIFSVKNNPEYLSTRDLLAALCKFEDRPWHSWTTKSGRRLGTMLHPFGIGSHTLSPDSEAACKGYRFRDLHDTWERYLPPQSESSVYRQVGSAAEENVGYNGTPTDSEPLISAIDAGSNGITEKRNAFKRKHSPKGLSHSSLDGELDSASEENVGYNGSPTDSEPSISAIDADSNGITEKRNAFKRKSSPEGSSHSSLDGELGSVAEEENVGYNGTPADSEPLISAIDAGSNGITEKRKDFAREDSPEQLSPASGYSTSSLDAEADSAGEENVCLHGTNTDCESQNPAIDADPHGNAETRHGFTGEDSPEPLSPASRYSTLSPTSAYPTGSLDPEVDSAGEENVCLHGMNTDCEPQNPAIDADPHGNTATRNGFTREHSPEQQDDSSAYRELGAAGEENVSLHGTNTDCESQNPAIDADPHGNTATRNDFTGEDSPEQVSPASWLFHWMKMHYGLMETPPVPTTADLCEE